jgi:hypothetical protein
MSIRGLSGSVSSSGVKAESTLSLLLTNRRLIYISVFTIKSTHSEQY